MMAGRMQTKVGLQLKRLVSVKVKKKEMASFNLDDCKRHSINLVNMWLV